MIYLEGFKDKTEGKWQINITRHLNQEEYKNHINNLANVGKINSMTNIYSLVMRNGNEYLEFAKNMKLDTNTLQNINFLEANRLLINYLSSVSMFIDYSEKYNKKYFGKEKLKEFQSSTHTLYDSHVSYRLIALLRNYALHYGFPLTTVSQSIHGPNGLFASKESLLRFDGWKHVKKDIESMPDLISFDIHVDISMMFLKHLYDRFIYDIAPTVLKGIEYYSNLIKESKGKLPILATSRSLEEYKTGKMSLNDFDPNEYMKALEIIKENPSIELKML